MELSNGAVLKKFILFDSADEVHVISYFSNVNSG